MISSLAFQSPHKLLLTSSKDDFIFKIMSVALLQELESLTFRDGQNPRSIKINLCLKRTNLKSRNFHICLPSHSCLVGVLHMNVWAPNFLIKLHT